MAWKTEVDPESGYDPQAELTRVRKVMKERRRAMSDPDYMIRLAARARSGDRHASEKLDLITFGKVRPSA